MFRVTIEKNPPKEWPTLSKAYYAIDRAYAAKGYGETVRWRIDDLKERKTCSRKMAQGLWMALAESPSAFGLWLNAMGWKSAPRLAPSPPTTRKRANDLDPALAEWLKDLVYPRLSHTDVFGHLPNFKVVPDGGFIADCPACQSPKAFFGHPDWTIGRCRKCQRVIGWYAAIRYPGYDDETAIFQIARLAGVTTGPNGQPLGEPDPLPTLDLSKLFRHPPVPIEPDNVPENPDSDPGTPYPPSANPNP